MTAKRYDIHGLVEVVIGADVCAEVVKEIDFQIGAFRVAANTQSLTAMPQVLVRSYAAAAEYENEKGRTEAVF